MIEVALCCQRCGHELDVEGDKFYVSADRDLLDIVRIRCSPCGLTSPWAADPLAAFFALGDKLYEEGGET
jgi:hypothetical protein